MPANAGCPAIMGVKQ